MRRAQVSAASKNDRLHKYNGKVGIVNDQMVDGKREKNVRIYFTEGYTVSMLVPRHKLYFLTHDAYSIMNGEKIWSNDKEDNDARV